MSNGISHPGSQTSQVQQVLRFAREDMAATRLAKLEQALQRYRLPLAEVIPLFTALLSVPLPNGRYPALTLPPPRQRQQTQDALIGWLRAEAHTLVEQHEKRFWEAEVSRLQGVLLLRQPGTPQAKTEAWLQRALDVAGRQEATALELRAAMSLSRLWQQQGKRQAAHDLLAEVYAWLTEGFDTADLHDAKTLLEELA
jgi:hypothetical protein